MEIEISPKKLACQDYWPSQSISFIGTSTLSTFSNLDAKSPIDNEVESRNSTIALEIKKQGPSNCSAEFLIEEEQKNTRDLTPSFPLFDSSDENLQTFMINQYQDENFSTPQETKLLQFFSDPDQYDPYTFRPRYNGSYSYIYEKNNQPETFLNLSYSLMRHELLRGAGPHVDVGKQFLKIHMKKCLNFAICNVDGIKETLRVMFFEENAAPFAFNLELKERLLTAKITELRRWLCDLRSRCKHYGKQDFKDAYVENNIQQVITKFDKSSTVGYERSRMLLEEVNLNMNENLLKEAFRRISLKFVLDKGPYGLMGELNLSNNVGDPTEHAKYLELMKWLLEKPTRIEVADITKKSWVDSFFRTIKK